MGMAKNYNATTSLLQNGCGCQLPINSSIPYIVCLCFEELRGSANVWKFVLTSENSGCPIKEWEMSYVVFRDSKILESSAGGSFAAFYHLSRMKQSHTFFPHYNNELVSVEERKLSNGISFYFLE